MKFTIYGGILAPAVDLSIAGELPVSLETVKANIDHAKGLAIASVDGPVAVSDAKRKRLAVVGGGPSIKQNVERLKAWDGDIWAINGADAWCRGNGIESTLFVIDPHPIVVQWARGAQRAIVATQCDPAVFEVLKGAEVTTISVGDVVKSAGGCAATCAPYLAAMMGYAEVTLFGCESSYDIAGTHAYMNEPRTDALLVSCGGDDYLTASDYFLYAQELAAVIRAMPEFVKEESGGFLRALIKHKEFDVRWVCLGLAEGLTPVMKTAEEQPRAAA